MADEEKLRRAFADAVADRAGCRDSPVHAAFASVDRHDFVGPGPWYFMEGGAPSDTSDPALVYRDVVVGLVPEQGITNGLPSLHARCMSACEPRRGERIVHLGAGSGYYTAIFADIVGESGHVDAFEINESLAAQAERNLIPWPWVTVHARSAIGAAVEKADVIYVCAGVEQLPLEWLTALQPGGRLLCPLTPLDDEGAMLIVRHVGTEDRYEASFLCVARFFPLSGALDPTATERLREAFAAGDMDVVRSLRLSPHDPDHTAWFSGDGWWLSSAPPR